MRLLGAILAGGAARRFGSDKAAALLDGVALLDHVAAALTARCERIVVVGRDWPGLERIDDRPAPGLGPLGGLAGALAYAAGRGFDAVLTSGCDLPTLPRDLVGMLGAPDALLADQPTVGMWQADRADALCRFVETDAQRSIYGWANAIGARRITGVAIPNVNRVEDLALLRHPGGRRDPSR